MTNMLDRMFPTLSYSSPATFDPDVVRKALPFFGGEGPETPDPSSTGSATDSPTAGGNSGSASSGAASTTDDGSGQSTDISPQQVSDLLKQVADLTKNVGSLTKENATYKEKETQATRAAQSREETLEQDLTEAQQTIAKMDSVIRHVALVNAIQANKDLQFHSAKHVLRELDPNAFELDVDLETGTATVTGIENDLKRIAKECSWLVKTTAGDSGGPAPAAPRRPSGNPPGPTGTSGDKATRRADLIGRYPVIAHGKRPATRG